MTKRTKIIGQTLFLVFLIAGTCYIANENRREKEEAMSLQPGTVREEGGFLTNSGEVFGTFYHIKYQSEKDLKPLLVAEMARVDSSLSMFNKQSTVARINAGESRQTDAYLREVFRLAQRVYASTDGCFDPTVAPLVNAWGFGFKSGALPNEAQVDSLKSLIGLKRVRLTNELVEKEDARITLDFSAIAKGYAVDKVAEVLGKAGIRNYMVEIGGEVIVRGKNPKGKDWSVGIAKPAEDNVESGELQEVKTLTNQAMATSGNYRNFYVTADGRKLAHTIDPHSGYPVQHSILSSTVFAPTCAEADAFATAFMVMGLEAAREVLQQQPQLKAYLIYTDGDGAYKVFDSTTK